MRGGQITCKHCHGIGKIFKWWIFPKICPYCNGLGDIWVDNIEKYFKKQLNQIMKKELNVKKIEQKLYIIAI